MALTDRLPRLQQICAWLLMAAGSVAFCGSHVMYKAPPVLEAVKPACAVPPHNNMPRELAKVTLPQYTIEPPDILTIEAIRIVPRSPYRVNTLDVLLVQVAGTLPESPIAGPTYVGGFSGKPVTHMPPPMACAIGSKLLKPL